MGHELTRTFFARVLMLLSEGVKACCRRNEWSREEEDGEGKEKEGKEGRSRRFFAFPSLACMLWRGVRGALLACRSTIVWGKAHRRVEWMACQRPTTDTRKRTTRFLCSTCTLMVVLSPLAQLAPSKQGIRGRLRSSSQRVEKQWGSIVGQGVKLTEPTRTEPGLKHGYSWFRQIRALRPGRGGMLRAELSDARGERERRPTGLGDGTTMVHVGSSHAARMGSLVRRDGRCSRQREALAGGVVGCWMLTRILCRPVRQ